MIAHIYVEILPLFRSMNAELKKGVEQSLHGVQQQIQSVSTNTHKMVEQTSGGALKRIAAVGVAAGSLAAMGIASLGRMAAGATIAGLKTAAGMEQAQIAFSTLLHSTTQAQKFLGNLKDFAAKTPFELPGLIDASRQLLGVGAKAKDVIPTLTAYGDAAGALGLNQEAFNRIMLATTQAMSNGKLQAGDLQQMTEAGLPVWTLLGKALGKPVSEIRKLSEQGKLLSKDVLPLLQKQMLKDYGGAMGKQAMTLSGLWSTLMDTMHQGEADVLMPMAPMLRVLIPKAAEVMGKGFKALGLGMAQFFGGLSGNVQRMAQGDRSKLELFGLGLRAMWLAFKEGDVTSKGFIGVMERIGVTVRKVFAYVSNTVIPAIRDMVGNFKVGTPEADKAGTAFASIGESLKKLGPLIQKAAAQLPSFTDILTVTASVLHFAADHVDTLTKLLPLLVIGFLAVKTAQLAANVAAAVSVPMKVAEVVVNRQLVKSNRELIASRAGVTATTVTGTVAEGASNAAKTTGLIAWVRSTVAVVAHGVALVATTAATKLAAAGAWLLSGAMKGSLGPIGIVITLIAALVAGIIYAYKHSEKFRSIVDAVGRALKTFGQWMLSAGESIGKFFGSLWSKLVQTWNAVWKFLKTWGPVALAVLAPFIGIPLLIWKHFDQIKGFMVRVWNGAYSAVVGGVKNVLGFIGTLNAKILSLFASAPRWLVTKGRDILIGLLAGVLGQWNTVSSWFSKMLSRVSTAIGNARLWMSRIGTNIIGGLWDGITSAWNSVLGWFKKIPGWIKSALGIKSPPAWAVDAGGWIMKGLIKGIIGGSFSLTQFLKHFTGLARTRIASFLGGAHGSVGAGGLHADILAALSAVRKQFGDVRLISGLRPGSRTLSGNLSRHAVGEAVDIPAVYSMTRWISQTLGRGLRELISPWNEWNILRGQHHTYTGDVFAQHAGTGRFKGNAHTHMAYERGAWRIPNDQLAYLHAREMVVPAQAADAIRAGGGGGGTTALDDATINKLAAAIVDGIKFGINSARRADIVHARQYGMG